MTMERPLDTDPDGSTPLADEELYDLIPSHISTRAELNQAEHDNIQEALLWVRKKARNPLDVPFLTKLHKRMFGQVWRWAGQFRRTDKNIGIPSYEIQVAMRQLVDDVQYQLDHQVYSPDDLAVRFHHRLVVIHPFPNGNGRHGRMATDMLLRYMGWPPFTWGSADLTSSSIIRSRYIEALQAADRGDYRPLMAFVRS
jgi:Fic-DOC domain mobile mystery protein B